MGSTSRSGISMRRHGVSQALIDPVAIAAWRGRTA